MNDVLSTLVIRAIHVYRRLLSPLFGPRCRFHPSCSHYAEESIRRFGPWRGSTLALRRLSRCHPLNAGGFDPVPDLPPAEHCRHAHHG